MKMLILTLIIPMFAWTAELVEKTLAIVNDQVILSSDLKKFRLKLDQPGMIDEVLLFGDSIDAIKKDQRLQLQYLINEKILDSEIQKLNLAVTIERVDQEMRDLAKKNGITKDALIAAVKNQGVSLSNYQAFLKSRIERQSLIESEITSKIRIADEDILAYYLADGKNSYSKAYEYSISHILILPRPTPQTALEKASTLLSKVTAGNFESFADENSEDPNFSKGGILGTFKSGEISKELELAVESLEPGQIYSKIVQTRAGFHIVKLMSKKLIPNPKFETEKDAYRSKLFENIFKRQLKAWVDLKREESFIKVN